jgi:hypothetical protein
MRVGQREPVALELAHDLLHGSLAAGDEDPGLVVFGADDTVELANPAAQAWLDEVPVAIRAVALAARDGSAVARARVRRGAGCSCAARCSASAPR